MGESRREQYNTGCDTERWTHDVEPPVELSLFALMLDDAWADSVTVTTAVTPSLVWVDRVVTRLHDEVSGVLVD